MKMNNATDQGWDQIQARINRMLGKYVGQELHKIEDRSMVHIIENHPAWREISGRTITAETKKL
jgi:hypothetical protein